MNRQRSHATTVTTRIAGSRIAAVLATMVLFGLAACGGGSSGSEEPTAGTSPESALAVGDTVDVLGWEVTVTAVELDATASLTTGVLASEPDPGHQFAKVVYEGTYRGDDPENSFYSDLNVVFWIDGVEYDDCKANVPPEFSYAASVDVGDTVTSAICAQIPADRTGEVLVNIKDWRPVKQSGFFFAAE